MKYRLTILFVALLGSFLSVYSQQTATSPKREMRAVWIATVENIDWPPRSSSPQEQKDAMIIMLDQLAENNINTVVFQIRPTADALYYSNLEPWSKFLTGTQGLAPNPFYDPLEFVIQEAHKRFMEVHVWLNPYRVSNNKAINTFSKDHLFFKNKNLFVEYGGKYYFNPGLDETRDFITKVVKDIVDRYDIDALHMDDYFYPYPVAGVDFPDADAFKKYPRGFTNLGDWRRNNVNMVIADIQRVIKNSKPWVDFGISPFGVWRNKSVDPMGSDTRALQNYDDLYADILKWLRDGSIDYVVPQLYWEIGKTVADYAILVDWWSRNSYNKNLYIGLIPSSLGSGKAPAWKEPNEICRQLRLNKEHPHVSGAMYFSAKGFLRNAQGLNDSLKTDFYQYRAICPENPNVFGTASPQPQNLKIIKDNDDAFLKWDACTEKDGLANAYYVVYAFKGKEVGDFNNPANILTFTHENFIDLNGILPEVKGYYTFVVSSINRFRKESRMTYAVTRRL